MGLLITLANNRLIIAAKRKKHAGCCCWNQRNQKNHPCSGDGGTGWHREDEFQRKTGISQGKSPLEAQISAQHLLNGGTTRPPLSPLPSQGLDYWVISGLLGYLCPGHHPDTFPAWISCTTSDPTGSRAQPGPSLLQENIPGDIFLIPWEFSALGAWGGGAGPPHIQLLKMGIPGKGHNADLQLINHPGALAGTAELGIFLIF